MSNAATLHADMRSAIRQRLLQLRVYTTGLTTLAVANGKIVRTSGSFVDEGFQPGDQVETSGFGVAANNSSFIVSEVVPLTLTLDRRLTTEAAAGQRRADAGLVAGRAWEGREFTPVRTQPFFRETVRPVSSVVRSIGDGAVVEHILTCNLAFYYPVSLGLRPLEKQVGAVLALFQPASSLYYNGNLGQVIKTQRTAVRQEPDWVSASVSFDIRSHTGVGQSAPPPSVNTISGVTFSLQGIQNGSALGFNGQAVVPVPQQNLTNGGNF
jgi:hypothetical protein